MPEENSQDLRSANSVTSDDRALHAHIRRSKTSSKTANFPRGFNEDVFNTSHPFTDGQGLEARLADILASDEWEAIAQSDPGRSSAFAPIREKIVDSWKAITYLNKLENGAVPAAAGSNRHFNRRQSREPEMYQAGSPADDSSASNVRTRNFVNDSTSTKGSETSGWKLEVKRWKRVDGRTGSMDIYDESQNIEEIRRREREIQGGNNIINVYDVYESEGTDCETLLEISSTPLLDLLRAVITYYPGEEFDMLRGGNNLDKDSWNGATTFHAPYVMLFDCRKRLKNSLKEDFPEEAKKHMAVLLEFLATEHPAWSEKLTQIEELNCKKLQYHAVWLLYPPNTPVYVVGSGDDERQVVVYGREVAFRGQSIRSTRDIKGSITLKCWDVKFEHGTFRRTFTDYVIEPYAGARPIEQLPLVPAAYMPEESKLRQRLIARGRRYYELKQAVQLQDYVGDQFPRVFSDEPVRVVVDESTYRKKHPYKASPNSKTADTYGFPEGEASLIDHKDEPLDSTLLRCFPELGVFSLRDRQWALVKIENLRPVKFREKAFSRLVMKRDYKDLLKALVKAYMQESAYFTDIVAGKGRGLAILLHGPPGTGKTLTAECVAEREQRPLYTISCGDLGTEPEQLEMRLKEVFEHAVTWKAILLLDEADLFLQERNINDLKRSALVTIFLRELEYFDGIIFMTTNRPGDIDEAFVSRIHVSLELSQPGIEERLKIWRLFIKEIEMPENLQRELLQSVTKFEKDNLNGRQIRNAIRVALALAKLEQSPVHLDHLEEVIKIGRDFARYNEDLNKMTPEDLAVHMGKRAYKIEAEA